MIPTFSFKKYDTFSAFSYLHFCTWQQWKTDHAVINCTAVMIIWVITHFVHRSTYNKRVNISAFGSIRHRLQKQQIRRNWNHKDPNLVEECIQLVLWFVDVQVCSVYYGVKYYCITMNTHLSEDLTSITPEI